MELTGKCKEDFESYFYKGLHLEFSEIEIEYQFNAEKIDIFYELPDSAKWGVYQDFFDSVGIETDYLFENEIYYLLTQNNGDGGVSYYRNKARTVAIEKATELYNSRP